MREQDGDGDRKAKVAMSRCPIAAYGVPGVCIVHQPSEMPTLEGYGGQQCCEASGSTYISHYTGCTVATVTGLGVFRLRKKPVGRIDHAASRALRQPPGLLNEQYASTANKRVR